MVYPRRLIERQKKGLYISPAQQVQIDAYRLRERLRQRGIRNRRLSRASEHEDDRDNLPDPDIEQDLELQSPAASPENADNGDNYQDSTLHSLDFATHTDNLADCSAICNRDCASDLSPQQSQRVSTSVRNQIGAHDLLGSLNTDVDDLADDKYFQNTNTDTSLNSTSTTQDLFQLLEMTAFAFHGLGRSSSTCQVPALVASRQQVHTPSAVYASAEPSASYFSNRDSSVSDSAIDAELYVMSAQSPFKSLDTVLSTSSFSNTPQDESDTEAEYTAGQSTAAYYTPRSDHCSLFSSTPASSLLSVSTSPDLGFVDTLLWPDRFVEFDMVYPPSPAFMLQREKRFSDNVEFFI
ncbi:hypothetical protein V1523DRAFT_261833 [Lipomyces doorenjongii]